MDPVRNPFAPGAGTPPPELVGREDILDQVGIAFQRALLGKPAKSWMLLGLRGTGKTVLLVRIGELAAERGFQVVKLESPQSGRLPQLLYPALQKVLRKLSATGTAKAVVHAAMKGLRSFGAAFKIEHQGISISVDPEPGVADSGQLHIDLPELIELVGKAAKASGSGLVLLIDEVQYLSKTELSALITAIHKANQLTLPVLVVGAGLPQVAALAGEARSYSERLFDWRTIGALTRADAARAIRGPIAEEDETIGDDAVDRIVSDTEGYPYFLQEWGYQAWNGTDASPITLRDVEQASHRALKRLDDGFFRVRLDQLTPRERAYVQAMASLEGEGPYATGDIAEALGEPPNRLAQLRAGVVRKGMIYGPQHGFVAFSVPGFKAFMRRQNNEVGNGS